MSYLVYNPNTQGEKEYAEQQYNKFINGEFDFKEVHQIRNEYITGV